MNKTILCTLGNLITISYYLPNCMNTISHQEKKHHLLGIDLNKISKLIPSVINTNHTTYSPLEMQNESLLSQNTLPSFFGINLESIIGSISSALKQSFTVLNVLDSSLIGLLTLELPIIGSKISNPLSISGFSSIQGITNKIRNSITNKKYVSTIKDKNPQEIISQENLTWGDLGVEKQLPFDNHTLETMEHTPINQDFLASYMLPDHSLKQIFLSSQKIEAVKNQIIVTTKMSLPVYNSETKSLVPYHKLKNNDSCSLNKLDVAKSYQFPIKILTQAS